MFKGKVPAVSNAAVNRVEKNILREEIIKEVAEEMAAMRSVIASQRKIIDSQHATISSLEYQLRSKPEVTTEERVTQLNMQIRKLKRIVKKQKERIDEVRSNLRAFFGSDESLMDPSNNVNFH